MKTAMAIAAASLVVTLGMHLWLLDGLDGALFGLLLAEDTKYAARYTDAGFRAVTKGMTEAEVVKLIGEPLDRLPLKPEIASARWSTSAEDSHYRIRAIVFDHGRVLKKYSGFYAD